LSAQLESILADVPPVNIEGKPPAAEISDSDRIEPTGYGLPEFAFPV